MNKLIFVLFCVLSVGALKAQELTKGSLAPLLDQSVVNVEFNTTEATFGDMPLQVFSDSRENNKKGESFIEELAQETKEKRANFLKIANKETKYFRYQVYLDAEYTLEVKLLTIDESGRESTYDFIFKNSKTNEVVAIVNMKSKGGHWGAFFNLWGDAIKDGTPKLVKFVNNQLKKAQKGK